MNKKIFSRKPTLKSIIYMINYALQLIKAYFCILLVYLILFLDVIFYYTLYNFSFGDFRRKNLLNNISQILKKSNLRLFFIKNFYLIHD